jgi:predicted alpha/beta hydrolase
VAETRRTTLSIPAADGYPLAATLYEPEAPPAAVVLVNSATATPRRFYARFAERLAEGGGAVVTYDYRGIGDSLDGHARTARGTMRDWALEDYAGALSWTRDRWPGARLACVGHSVGGQMLGLVDGSSQLASIVLVGAQIGYWGHWPAPRRLLYAALWHAVMPATTRALGYFPGRRLGMGEDLPPGVALDWARWCRTPEFFVDERGRPLPLFFDAVRAPVLSLSVSDDAFAPAASVDALARRYARARVERRHVDARELPGGRAGHFGLFREPIGRALWGEMARWLLGENTCSSPSH